MATRIVFTAPGVKSGVLTQVFAEDPDQVFEAFIAKGGLPFPLTAGSRRKGHGLQRRKEVVYINPSTIAYWTEYVPPGSRATGEE